jgi:hypothetical protein
MILRLEGACIGPVLGCTVPVLSLSWAVLGRLGPVLGCLGQSWAVLGLSWACLGPVLGCLGLVFGCPGPVLGCLGLSWACLGPVLGHLGPSWTSMSHLGAILGHLGAILRPSWFILGQLRTTPTRERPRIYSCAPLPRESVLGFTVEHHSHARASSDSQLSTTLQLNAPKGPAKKGAPVAGNPPSPLRPEGHSCKNIAFGCRVVLNCENLDP